MKLARNIDRGLLVAAAFALALPALAHANPLLSGYGGPGQGSQALLGATLTGPRGGGGGDTGGGSAYYEGTPARDLEAHAATATAPVAQSGHSSKKAPSTRSRGSHSSGSASAGAGSGPGGSGPTQTDIAPARSVQTDTAGISGGDLALILLGIGVVAATGFLMARLARPGAGRTGS